MPSKKEVSSQRQPPRKVQSSGCFVNPEMNNLEIKAAVSPPLAALRCSTVEAASCIERQRIDNRGEEHVKMELSSVMVDLSFLDESPDGEDTSRCVPPVAPPLMPPSRMECFHVPTHPGPPETPPQFTLKLPQLQPLCPPPMQPPLVPPPAPPVLPESVLEPQPMILPPPIAPLLPPSHPPPLVSPMVVSNSSHNSYKCTPAPAYSADISVFNDTARMPRGMTPTWTSTDKSCSAPPGLTVMNSGSALHASGKCQPCAWFWKPGGCQNEQDCSHCHLCPANEIKNRKKARRQAMRSFRMASERIENIISEPLTIKLEREMSASTPTTCSGSEQGSINGAGSDEESAVDLAAEPSDPVDLAAACLPSKNLMLTFPPGLEPETAAASWLPLPPGLETVPTALGGGSVLHSTSARCLCASVSKGASCERGPSCAFCHLCPKGELKARNKSRAAVQRVNFLPR